MKRRFFSSLPVYSLSFLLSLGFTSTSSYAADESPAKKKKPGGTDIGNNGDELRIEFAATSAEFLNDLEEYLGAQSSEWANTTKQKIKDFRGRSLLWAESLDGQSSLCIHGLSEEDELMISPRNCGRLQWRIDVVIEWFRYLELGEPDKYVRYLITKKPDHWLVALKTDNEIELDGVDFKSSNGHGTFKLSLKKETGLLVVDESSLEYSIKGETVKPRFAEIFTWVSNKEFFNGFEGLVLTHSNTVEWAARVYPLSNGYACLRMTSVPRAGTRVLRPSVVDILKQVKE